MSLIFHRHCERSEAIQEQFDRSCPWPLDCFVATLLAMTEAISHQLWSDVHNNNQENGLEP